MAINQCKFFGHPILCFPSAGEQWILLDAHDGCAWHDYAQRIQGMLSEQTEQCEMRGA